MTDDLFDVNDATHVAVSSGAWTNPSTWEGGRIPDANAKVHIPMGIKVEYDSTSQARLEVVRVDGTLDFATNQNTHMLVESVFTGHMSTLTIGTSDNPVQAGVTAEMVFADGQINLAVDPDKLGHGLVAEGRVEMYGHEKDPYTTLNSNAMAGATSLVLDAGTDGWSVGDTIVVMGTSQGDFQDEYRQITSIQQGSNGVVVQLDRPLNHNHTTPEGHDLDIFVGNSTRNVVLSSENPEGVRGHVMMMHTPDVAVSFTEFSELGRTDKSIPLDVLGNVAGRYPLHLHETGVSPDTPLAVLYGNSVHGSPGWGIVQHSSAAAVDFNFVHNIDGAGIVSEDGDEIGQWVGNFVTGVAGTGDKFSIKRDELDADFGHSGVAYENQSRLIVQQDNIAANSNTGWMFRAAIISVDDADRDSVHFDPAPFKNIINNEEAAIIGFHGNIAAAVDTVMDTGHRVDVSTTTDLRSDIIDMVAWEVRTVFNAMSYTAEYVIENGLFIGTDGAGRAVVFPHKHESTSIINTHFENFRTAIFDVGYNADGVYVGLTFKDVQNKLEAEQYGNERLKQFSDINIVAKPVLAIDSSSDLTMGKNDKNIYISGTITDSAGTLVLGSNRWINTPTSDQDGISNRANVNGNSSPEELLAVHGALRQGGEWIMPVALWITDRVTGEHFPYRIDIKLVGYTDAFLQQFEIAGFNLPTNEIKIVDSYAIANDGTSSGGHHNHNTGGHGTNTNTNTNTDTNTNTNTDTETSGGDHTDHNTTSGGHTDHDMTGGGSSDQETNSGGDTTDHTTSGGHGTDHTNQTNDADQDPVSEGQSSTESAGGPSGGTLEFTRSGVSIQRVDLEDDFTIMGWVRLDEGKAIDFADAIVGGTDFDLNFKDGHLTVVHGDTDIAKSTVAAEDGVWAHYSVVRKDGEVLIYLDGKEVGRSDQPWTEAIDVDALGNGHMTHRGLLGSLDEIRVWDTAHTAQQIDGFYNGTLQTDVVTEPLTAFDFEDYRDYGPRTEVVNIGGQTTEKPVFHEPGSSQVLELGQVTSNQANGSEWTAVSFGTAIKDAIVIMGPVSNSGVHEAFARVRNVTDTGFEFQIEEWDHLDGKHTTESISWMALSEGTHTLGNGAKLSAASLVTDADGDALIDPDGAEVVLAQVASDNNAEAVTARTAVQNDGTVAVDLQRQESATGTFEEETVFVVQIEEGAADHFEFASGVVSSVDSNGGTINFNTTFEKVAFLGSVSSNNDEDPVALRLDELDGETASVFLQEDRSADKETDHEGETVNWFAGEVGVYELA